MNFSQVLELIKQGCRVRRMSWDEGVHIKLQEPPKPDGYLSFYKVIPSQPVATHKFWEPGTQDILAEDWEVVMSPPHTQISLF